MTLELNSSDESHEPIFKSAVKAGAAAEPNSREEANKGSNCRDTTTKNEFAQETTNNKLKLTMRY